MATRREFIQKSALGAAGLTLGAKSYSRVAGANDRVRVGIVGFSDRFRGSLAPQFLAQSKELNFEIVAVSDLWSRRRDEATAYFREKGITIRTARNNDELYSGKDTDAVIISTADFQHALLLAEAVKAGHDVYCEKPFAETMADAREALKAVKETGKIVQTGSQVVYTSRFTNSAGGTKEIYFSNGGTLNLDTNKITPEGGLEEKDASSMHMKPNLLEPMDLPGVKIETSANTGSDPMTYAHMRNWMECVRSRRKPNADVVAGYNHSIANIMCTAALRTGEKASFDEATQEVLAGGKVFQY